MKKLEKSGNILNWLCLAAMGGLIVAQFLPYWHLDGGSIGLQQFIWLPDAFRDLKDYFVQSVGSFDINSFVGLPILTFAVAIGGIVVCVLARDQIWASLCPILCGAVGIYIYTADPYLALGVPCGVHLVLCITILALGIALAAVRLTQLFLNKD